MKNPFIIENTLTNEKIFKSISVDEEVSFDGGVMITETDTEGIITYTSRKFREMTGFSKEELIGSPHSITRHPDMPKGVFKAMWKVISEQKIWRGYIKSMRKDGRFYWALVYIQPKYNENDEHIGYIAGRKIAYPEAINEISDLYAEFHEDKYMDHEVFTHRATYSDYLQSRE